MDLTARELQILMLFIAKPKATNREIGLMLGIKKETVKMHIWKMNKKHGTKNKAELINLMK